MQDIVVHHLERSRSHRVLWLLEELGLSYRLETYQRDPKTSRAPKALRAIHPLGKAPVVTFDDAGTRVVLAESGAIIETLAEHVGKLMPSGGAEARRARYYLHYAEGSLMPPLLVRLIFDKLSTAKVPFFIKPIVGGIVKKVDAAFTTPELELQFSFLDAELASREFLAGDFSAADIQMSYPVVAGLARIDGTSRYPHVAAYATRLAARPAYQHAIKVGGPVLL